MRDATCGVVMLHDLDFIADFEAPGFVSQDADDRATVEFHDDVFSGSGNFFGDERLYIPDDTGDLLVVNFEIKRS